MPNLKTQGFPAETGVGVDHGLLSGLSDDDHAQYLLLAGRGGQSISDNVTIQDDATAGLTLRRDSTTQAVEVMRLENQGAAATNTGVRIASYALNDVGGLFEQGAIQFDTNGTFTSGSEDAEIRIYGRTNGALQEFLLFDGGGSRVQIISTDGENAIDVRAGNTNINRDKLNRDTIIKTQGNDNAVYVKASNDRIGHFNGNPLASLDHIGDARFGDSTTNYVEIESDGDVNFVSGAGLQYGEISGTEVGDTLTISGTGVANKVQITSFSVNGESNGSVTPDHTNDHVTVGKAGRYEVSCRITAESAAAGGSAEIAASIFANNGVTRFTNTTQGRKLTGGGGDVGFFDPGGICPLSANDTVEVWIWNETNTDNIVIDDVTLTVKQLGG